MQIFPNSIESLLANLVSHKTYGTKAKMLLDRLPGANPHMYRLVERWLQRNATSLPYQYHDLIENPVWEIPADDKKEFSLCIEGNMLKLSFTPNKQLTESQLKSVFGLTVVDECKKYISGIEWTNSFSIKEGRRDPILTCPATENNLLELWKIFEPVVTAELRSLIKEIEQVDPAEVIQQFSYPTTPLPATTQLSNLLLLNNRIRYQWNVSDDLVSGDSLVIRIAKRPVREVYMQQREFGLLTELLQSIKTLEQFPLMLVFDEHDPVRSTKALHAVKSALKELGISDVGIYFRYDNLAGKDFNDAVKQAGLNQRNTATTQVVGVSAQSLPKLLLKTGWKPRSVLSFTEGFRGNRVFNFANTADLVIYHTLTKPMVVSQGKNNTYDIV